MTITVLAPPYELSFPISVRFAGEGLGFNPHWLRTTPHWWL